MGVNSFSLSPQTKSFLFGLSISIIVLTSSVMGAIADRLFGLKPLDYMVQQGWLRPARLSPQLSLDASAVGSVADVAEKSSESVVTVAARRQQRVVDPFFNGIFGFDLNVRPQAELREIKQDIGSGFVVDQGLVVTNRHVVADLQAGYSVIDRQDREHQVVNIYRDPVNDLAILRVEGDLLPGLALGDSQNLRVGEPVIAIGTALGEFRHTVTTGVVSGLGRGVQAIGALGDAVESLEGVIQTDAAINPGNSGGPLLNLHGQVIGVNVAVTAGAQNIGFAIPINVVKESLGNFNQTGQFERAALGVTFRQVNAETAELNQIPQGAYLIEVRVGSAAAEVGLKSGDIITVFDGVKLEGGDNLAKLINQHKVGDKVSVEYWRDGETNVAEVTLSAQ